MPAELQKRIFRIFLFTGIPFGLIFGVGGVIATGHIFSSIVFGLISGVFFGLWMALILGLLNIALVNSSKYGSSKDSLSIKQMRVIELNLPFEQAFDLCLRSFSTINRSTILINDLENGRIVARTWMNWKTYGDVVEFKLEKRDEVASNIKLTSRPLLKTTIVDLGKNLDNVEKILSFIHENGKACESTTGDSLETRT